MKKTVGKTYQFLFTASVLGFVSLFISFNFRCFVPNRLCEFITERRIEVKIL